MNRQINSLRKEMADFYNLSEEYLSHLAAEDEGYFKRYIQFIRRFSTGKEKLLDLGCGTGLSTSLLRKAGFSAVGTDISGLFLREALRRKDDKLVFSAADSMELPFKDSSFDIVSSYLMIEFIPDVEKALFEMMRVLRPGGKIIIIGPNLCSPFMPLYDFTRMIFGGKGRPVWTVNKTMAFKNIFKNSFLSLGKIISREPKFLYRQPDLSCKEAVGRDSDSVYLASQIDLKKFFVKNGFQILNCGNNSDLVQRFFPDFSVSLDTVVMKK